MAEADGQPPAVALVGFMGAGKSVVGKELAAALGLPFVDTDDLVVAAAGPIPDIFSAGGEAGFRAIEEEVVTAAIARCEERPCVLGLGGGAVLSDDVREALGRLPHVVWLTAPPLTLWARVSGGAAGARPLARDREAFVALLAAREPFYREVATQVVATEDRTPAAVVANLVAALEACRSGVGGPGARGDGR